MSIPVVTSPASIFGLMPQLKHTWPACISLFPLLLSLTSGSEKFLIGCYDSYEPYVVLAGLSSFVLFKLFPEGICFLTEDLYLKKKFFFNLSFTLLCKRFVLNSDLIFKFDYHFVGVANI